MKKKNQGNIRYFMIFWFLGAILLAPFIGKALAYKFESPTGGWKSSTYNIRQNFAINEFYLPKDKLTNEMKNYFNQMVPFGIGSNSRSFFLQELVGANLKNIGLDLGAQSDRANVDKVKMNNALKKLAYFSAATSGTVQYKPYVSTITGVDRVVPFVNGYRYGIRFAVYNDSGVEKRNVNIVLRIDSKTAPGYIERIGDVYGRDLRFFDFSGRELYFHRRPGFNKGGWVVLRVPYLKKGVNYFWMYFNWTRWLGDRSRSASSLLGTNYNVPRVKYFVEKRSGTYFYGVSNKVWTVRRVCTRVCGWCSCWYNCYYTPYIDDLVKRFNLGWNVTIGNKRYYYADVSSNGNINFSYQRRWYGFWWKPILCAECTDLNAKYDDWRIKYRNDSSGFKVRWRVKHYYWSGDWDMQIGLLKTRDTYGKTRYNNLYFVWGSTSRTYDRRISVSGFNLRADTYQESDYKVLFYRKTRSFKFASRGSTTIRLGSGSNYRYYLWAVEDFDYKYAFERFAVRLWDNFNPDKPSAGPAFSWWNSEYKRRIPIVIFNKYGKTVYNVQIGLLLKNLPKQFWDVERNTYGYDLRVVSPSGKVYPFYLVKYYSKISNTNSRSAKDTLWFKIDKLNAGVTTVYLYFDSAKARKRGNKSNFDATFGVDSSWPWTRFAAIWDYSTGYWRGFPESYRWDTSGLVNQYFWFYYKYKHWYYRWCKRYYKCWRSYTCYRRRCYYRCYPYWTRCCYRYRCGCSWCTRCYWCRRWRCYWYCYWYRTRCWSYGYYCYYWYKCWYYYWVTGYKWYYYNQYATSYPRDTLWQDPASGVSLKHNYGFGNKYGNGITIAFNGYLGMGTAQTIKNGAESRNSTSNENIFYRYWNRQYYWGLHANGYIAPINFHLDPSGRCDPAVKIYKNSSYTKFYWNAYRVNGTTFTSTWERAMVRIDKNSNIRIYNRTSSTTLYSDYSRGIAYTGTAPDGLNVTRRGIVVNYYTTSKDGASIIVSTPGTKPGDSSNKYNYIALRKGAYRSNYATKYGAVKYVPHYYVYGNVETVDKYIVDASPFRKKIMFYSPSDYSQVYLEVRIPYINAVFNRDGSRNLYPKYGFKYWYDFWANQKYRLSARNVFFADKDNRVLNFVLLQYNFGNLGRADYENITSGMLDYLSVLVRVSNVKKGYNTIYLYWGDDNLLNDNYQEDLNTSLAMIPTPNIVSVSMLEPKWAVGLRYTDKGIKNDLYVYSGENVNTSASSFDYFFMARITSSLDKWARMDLKLWKESSRYDVKQLASNYYKSGKLQFYNFDTTAADYKLYKTSGIPSSGYLAYYSKYSDDYRNNLIKVYMFGTDESNLYHYFELKNYDFAQTLNCYDLGTDKNENNVILDGNKLDIAVGRYSLYDPIYFDDEKADLKLRLYNYDFTIAQDNLTGTRSFDSTNRVLKYKDVEIQAGGKLLLGYDYLGSANPKAETTTYSESWKISGYDGKKWRYRNKIRVIGSNSNNNWLVLIPHSMFKFWQNVRTDFQDLVVTDTEGNIVKTRIVKLNYTNRELLLLLQDVPGTNYNSNWYTSNDLISKDFFIYYSNPDPAYKPLVGYVASARTRSIIKHDSYSKTASIIDYSPAYIISNFGQEEGQVVEEHVKRQVNINSDGILAFVPMYRYMKPGYREVIKIFTKGQYGSLEIKFKVNGKVSTIFMEGEKSIGTNIYAPTKTSISGPLFKTGSLKVIFRKKASATLDGLTYRNVREFTVSFIPKLDLTYAGLDDSKTYIDYDVTFVPKVGYGTPKTYKYTGKNNWLAAKSYVLAYKYSNYYLENEDSVSNYAFAIYGDGFTVAPPNSNYQLSYISDINFNSTITKPGLVKEKGKTLKVRFFNIYYDGESKPSFTKKWHVYKYENTNGVNTAVTSNLEKAYEVLKNIGKVDTSDNILIYNPENTTKYYDKIVFNSSGIYMAKKYIFNKNEISNYKLSISSKYCFAQIYLDDRLIFEAASDTASASYTTDLAAGVHQITVVAYAKNSSANINVDVNSSCLKLPIAVASKDYIRTKFYLSSYLKYADYNVSDHNANYVFEFNVPNDGGTKKLYARAICSGKYIDTGIANTSYNNAIYIHLNRKPTPKNLNSYPDLASSYIVKNYTTWVENGKNKEYAVTLTVVKSGFSKMVSGTLEPDKASSYHSSTAYPNYPVESNHKRNDYYADKYRIKQYSYSNYLLNNPSTWDKELAYKKVVGGKVSVSSSNFGLATVKRKLSGIVGTIAPVFLFDTRAMDEHHAENNWGTALGQYAGKIVLDNSGPVAYTVRFKDRIPNKDPLPVFFTNEDLVMSFKYVDNIFKFSDSKIILRIKPYGSSSWYKTFIKNYGVTKGSGFSISGKNYPVANVSFKWDIPSDIKTGLYTAQLQLIDKLGNSRTYTWSRAFLILATPVANVFSSTYTLHPGYYTPIYIDYVSPYSDINDVVLNVTIKTDAGYTQTIKIDKTSIDTFNQVNKIAYKYKRFLWGNYYKNLTTVYRVELILNPKLTLKGTNYKLEIQAVDKDGKQLGKIYNSKSFNFDKNVVVDSSTITLYWKNPKGNKLTSNNKEPNYDFDEDNYPKSIVVEENQTLQFNGKLKWSIRGNSFGNAAAAILTMKIQLNNAYDFDYYGEISKAVAEVDSSILEVSNLGSAYNSNDLTITAPKVIMFEYQNKSGTTGSPATLKFSSDARGYFRSIVNHISISGYVKGSKNVSLPQTYRPSLITVYLFKGSVTIDRNSNCYMTAAHLIKTYLKNPDFVPELRIATLRGTTEIDLKSIPANSDYRSTINTSIGVVGELALGGNHQIYYTAYDSVDNILSLNYFMDNASLYIHTNHAPVQNDESICYKEDPNAVALTGAFDSSHFDRDYTNVHIISSEIYLKHKISDSDADPYNNKPGDIRRDNVKTKVVLYKDGQYLTTATYENDSDFIKLDQDLNEGQISSSGSVMELSNVYRVEFKTIDEHGASSRLATAEFIIDKTPPTINTVEVLAQNYNKVKYLGDDTDKTVYAGSYIWFAVDVSDNLFVLDKDFLSVKVIVYKDGEEKFEVPLQNGTETDLRKSITDEGLDDSDVQKLESTDDAVSSGVGEYSEDATVWYGKSLLDMNLPEGWYDIKVVAVDKAGNEKEITQDNKFYVLPYFLSFVTNKIQYAGNREAVVLKLGDNDPDKVTITFKNLNNATLTYKDGKLEASTDEVLALDSEKLSNGILVLKYVLSYSNTNIDTDLVVTVEKDGSKVEKTTKVKIIRSVKLAGYKGSNYGWGVLYLKNPVEDLTASTTEVMSLMAKEESEFERNIVKSKMLYKGAYENNMFGIVGYVYFNEDNLKVSNNPISKDSVTLFGTTLETKFADVNSSGDYWRKTILKVNSSDNDKELALDGSIEKLMQLIDESTIDTISVEEVESISLNKSNIVCLERWVKNNSNIDIKAKDAVAIVLINGKILSDNYLIKDEEKFIGVNGNNSTGWQRVTVFAYGDGGSISISADREYLPYPTVLTSAGDLTSNKCYLKVKYVIQPDNTASTRVAKVELDGIADGLMVDDETISKNIFDWKKLSLEYLDDKTKVEAGNYKFILKVERGDNNAIELSDYTVFHFTNYPPAALFIPDGSDNVNGLHYASIVVKLNGTDKSVNLAVLGYKYYPSNVDLPFKVLPDFDRSTNIMEHKSSGGSKDPDTVQLFANLNLYVTDTNNSYSKTKESNEYYKDSVDTSLNFSGDWVKIKVTKKDDIPTVTNVYQLLTWEKDNHQFETLPNDRKDYYIAFKDFAPNIIADTLQVWDVSKQERKLYADNAQQDDNSVMRGYWLRCFVAVNDDLFGNNDSYYKWARFNFINTLTGKIDFSVTAEIKQVAEGKEDIQGWLYKKLSSFIAGDVEGFNNNYILYYAQFKLPQQARIADYKVQVQVSDILDNVATYTTDTPVFKVTTPKFGTFKFLVDRTSSSMVPAKLEDFSDRIVATSLEHAFIGEDISSFASYAGSLETSFTCNVAVNRDGISYTYVNPYVEINRADSEGTSEIKERVTPYLWTFNSTNELWNGNVSYSWNQYHHLAYSMVIPTDEVATKDVKLFDSQEDNSIKFVAWLKPMQPGKVKISFEYYNGTNKIGEKENEVDLGNLEYEGKIQNTTVWKRIVLDIPYENSDYVVIKIANETGANLFVDDIYMAKLATVEVDTTAPPATAIKMEVTNPHINAGDRVQLGAIWDRLPDLSKNSFIDESDKLLVAKQNFILANAAWTQVKAVKGKQSLFFDISATDYGYVEMINMVTPTLIRESDDLVLWTYVVAGDDEDPYKYMPDKIKVTLYGVDRNKIATFYWAEQENDDGFYLGKLPQTMVGVWKALVVPLTKVAGITGCEIRGMRIDVFASNDREAKLWLDNVSIKEGTGIKFYLAEVGIINDNTQDWIPLSEFRKGIANNYYQAEVLDEDYTENEKEDKDLAVSGSKFVEISADSNATVTEKTNPIPIPTDLKVDLEFWVYLFASYSDKSYIKVDVETVSSPNVEAGNITSYYFANSRILSGATYVSKLPKFGQWQPVRITLEGLAGRYIKSIRLSVVGFAKGFVRFDSFKLKNTPTTLNTNRLALMPKEVLYNENWSDYTNSITTDTLDGKQALKLLPSKTITLPLPGSDETVFDGVMLWAKFDRSCLSDVNSKLTISLVYDDGTSIKTVKAYVKNKHYAWNGNWAPIYAPNEMDLAPIQKVDKWIPLTISPAMFDIQATGTIQFKELKLSYEGKGFVNIDFVVLGFEAYGKGNWIKDATSDYLSNYTYKGDVDLNNFEYVYTGKSSIKITGKDVTLTLEPKDSYIVKRPQYESFIMRMHMDKSSYKPDIIKVVFTLKDGTQKEIIWASKLDNVSEEINLAGAIPDPNKEWVLLGAQLSDVGLNSNDEIVKLDIIVNSEQETTLWLDGIAMETIIPSWAPTSIGTYAAPDGLAYSIRALAVDNMGNVGDWGYSAVVQAEDRTPPEITLPPVSRLDYSRLSKEQLDELRKSGLVYVPKELENKDLGLNIDNPWNLSLTSTTEAVLKDGSVIELPPIDVVDPKPSDTDKKQLQIFVDAKVKAKLEFTENGIHLIEESDSGEYVGLPASINYREKRYYLPDNLYALRLVAIDKKGNFVKNYTALAEVFEGKPARFEITKIVVDDKVYEGEALKGASNEIPVSADIARLKIKAVAYDKANNLIKSSGYIAAWTYGTINPADSTVTENDVISMKTLLPSKPYEYFKDLITGLYSDAMTAEVKDGSTSVEFKTSTVADTKYYIYVTSADGTAYKVHSPVIKVVPGEVKRLAIVPKEATVEAVSLKSFSVIGKDAWDNDVYVPCIWTSSKGLNYYDLLAGNEKIGEPLGDFVSKKAIVEQTFQATKEVADGILIAVYPSSDVTLNNEDELRSLLTSKPYMLNYLLHATAVVHIKAVSNQYKAVFLQQYATDSYQILSGSTEVLPSDGVVLVINTRAEKDLNTGVDKRMPIYIGITDTYGNVKTENSSVEIKVVLDDNETARLYEGPSDESGVKEKVVRVENGVARIYFFDWNADKPYSVMKLYITNVNTSENLVIDAASKVTMGDGYSKALMKVNPGPLYEVEILPSGSEDKPVIVPASSFYEFSAKGYDYYNNLVKVDYKDGWSSDVNGIEYNPDNDGFALIKKVQLKTDNVKIGDKGKIYVSLKDENGNTAVGSTYIEIGDYGAFSFPCAYQELDMDMIDTGTNAVYQLTIYVKASGPVRVRAGLAADLNGDGKIVESDGDLIDDVIVIGEPGKTPYGLLPQHSKWQKFERIFKLPVDKKKIKKLYLYVGKFRDPSLDGEVYIDNVTLRRVK